MSSFTAPLAMLMNGSAPAHLFQKCTLKVRHARIERGAGRVVSQRVSTPRRPVRFRRAAPLFACLSFRCLGTDGVAA